MTRRHHDQGRLGRPACRAGMTPFLDQSITLVCKPAARHVTGHPTNPNKSIRCSKKRSYLYLARPQTLSLPVGSSVTWLRPRSNE